MGRSPLLDRLVQEINRYDMFGAAARVVVALSGGPDSVALTLLLVELKRYWPHLELHLAHFNHRLRAAESERDERYCRALATRLGLTIFVASAAVAEVAAKTGENLEATARRLRYGFLQQVADSVAAQAIATGHNMNDQAETLLMRLLRGAGPQGLAGIYPVIESAGAVKIVRPLLGVRRDEIEALLATAGEAACQDSSNSLPDYTRNRIRLEIMPKLSEINPRAVEAMARAAELIREEERAKQAAELEQADNRRLFVPALLEQPLAVRRRQIRAAIENFRGHLRRVTATHIVAIESLLGEHKSGKRVQLPGAIEVVREFDELIIKERGKAVTNKEVILKLGRSCQFGNFTLTYLPVGQDKGMTGEESGVKAILVDLNQAGERLIVRARRPGDRYRPQGHQSTEKLKNIMIENRIPVSKRDAWPVITRETGEFIWSPGLPAAQEVVAQATTGHFAIILAKC